jgi:prevent-host-death family protein
MVRRVSAAQAKSQLAECLRKAESGEAVIITRHGKPVAVLIGGDRMALIGRRGSRRRGGGLADLAGGWAGSGNLVKALAKARRTHSRRASRLDA